MAKIDFENGGRISGLVGNAVFAGDQVRVRPRKRKPDEWTEAQKAERVRYRAAVDIYKKLKMSLIQPVWSHSATKGLTAYNLFLRENLHAFNTHGNIKDPTMLKMAIGELSRPYNMKAALNPEDSCKVDISWENDSPNNHDRCRDHLVAVFFDGSRFSPPISTEFLRSNESASVTFPERFGEGSYVFVFFGNEEKNAYCESWVERV